jgi:hypothetical protein
MRSAFHASAEPNRLATRATNGLASGVKVPGRAEVVEVVLVEAHAVPLPAGPALELLVAGVGLLAVVGELGELAEQRVGPVDVAVVQLQVDLDLLVRDAVQALEGGVVLGLVLEGGVDRLGFHESAPGDEAAEPITRRTRR